MIYATENRLCRARESAYIGGVCAGLADYYELDAIVVRILAVLLMCLTIGLAGIAYIVLWARLPLESESAAPYDVQPESAESHAFGCVDCDFGTDTRKVSRIPLLARLAIAAGLMVLFLAVAMGVSPLVPGTMWWQFWPIAPLLAGLCLIVIPVHTRFEMVWHMTGIVVTALSASILPMSLGIMSWETISCSVERLWPVLIVSALLFAIGLSRRVDALLLASSFCFVAFCLLGITLCVIPGEIETLLLHMPTGHSVTIAIVG